jgi:hypothetical protein
VSLVTKHKPQPTSELFDSTYPGAHLSLDERRSLAPRWVSQHLILYAFPKAFLSRPDVPYSKPYKPRPYPEPPLCPEQRSVDMSMQVVAFHSRIVLRPFVRTKIKRRLKEAVRLIITRGAAVEESRKGPKIVFRAEDLGADKWIVPGKYMCHVPPYKLLNRGFCLRVVCRLDVHRAPYDRDVPYALCGAA